MRALLVVTAAVLVVVGAVVGILAGTGALARYGSPGRFVAAFPTAPRHAGNTRNGASAELWFACDGGDRYAVSITEGSVPAAAASLLARGVGEGKGEWVAYAPLDDTGGRCGAAARKVTVAPGVVATERFIPYSAATGSPGGGCLGIYESSLGGATLRATAMGAPGAVLQFIGSIAPVAR